MYYARDKRNDSYYEVTSFRDPVTKKPKSKRVCIGKQLIDGTFLSNQFYIEREAKRKLKIELEVTKEELNKTKKKSINAISSKKKSGIIRLKLDHITINVISMEESIIFYKEVLSLRMLNLVDMGNHIIQYFDLGGGARLELIEYKFDCKESKLTSTDKGMYRHLVFAVDDIMEIYDRVLQARFVPDNKPTFVDKLEFTNFLMKDPNGVELEIIQYKK
jgi:catechol 2,3-dioxygenase-like lactoylglutathione lyase family enzyme